MCLFYFRNIGTRRLGWAWLQPPGERSHARGTARGQGTLPAQGQGTSCKGSTATLLPAACTSSPSFNLHSQPCGSNCGIRSWIRSKGKLVEEIRPCVALILSDGGKGENQMVAAQFSQAASPWSGFSGCTNVLYLWPCWGYEIARCVRDAKKDSDPR